MKSSKKQEITRGLPTADELREALIAAEASPAYATLATLFDEGTFVETAAYTRRGYHEFVSEGNDDEFEGVVTGYGSVNGQLVFAFAQDITRMKGAMDRIHADKIISLYRLAIQKDAPVIGIFASCGAVIDEGVAALAAYGRILKTVTDAASIPQIAYVIGDCTGISAAIASSFDFVITGETASFYVTNPELGGKKVGASTVCYKGNPGECADYIRTLLGFLDPTNDDAPATDDINRRLDDIDTADIHTVLTAVADNGQYIPYSADYGTAAVTALTTIAGVRCGVVANVYAENNGRITQEAANKMADFIDLCDRAGLPVVTLVDSEGLAVDTDENAVLCLASTYTQATVPCVTVVLGHAIGAAFTLMGSKSICADMAYALEDAEIGVLSSKQSVAFAWNGEINGTVTREELEEKWRASIATSAAAAATGEIDDIITTAELRARIASALLMLTC